MSRIAVKPFLISKDVEAGFRLTVRETRFNSQGYPLVTATMQAESFATATAAKAHARDHFGAQAGEFATK